MRSCRAWHPAVHHRINNHSIRQRPLAPREAEQMDVRVLVRCVHVLPRNCAHCEVAFEYTLELCMDARRAELIADEHCM